MKYFKTLLWALTIIFIILNIFRIVPNNISVIIVLLSMGTVLLIEAIEYKNKFGNDTKFYTTIVFSILAYLFVIYMLFKM